MFRKTVIALILLAAAAPGQTGNKPQRLEWFRDLGFGLFIHWSFDSQLGMVISHSAVGASPDYLYRFFDILPQTFNPKRFDADEWAVLARLAGVRYFVFTTKHHSGFCMFQTGTTRFGIQNTPYGKDITAELVRAFKGQGIRPGFYFSPDDFHFLRRQGKTIDRHKPELAGPGNPELLAYDQEQVRELLTQYGNIDVMFFDGPPEGLRETAWRLQPEIVVTRGAIETPEQYIPGVPMDVPWEGNLTMGTQWQFKPTNEVYKSGGELIHALIETRAKGGNLLLNIGPQPNGEIPIQQEERLREIGLWMFLNAEAIYGVRPWVITNENNIWFTRKKGEDTVYAIVTGPRWPYGQWRDLTLKSVKAGARTQVSVLSQSDEVLEYQPKVIPKTTWKQEADGLHIRAMRAQRIYNDRKWPNPVVLKITGAQAGMQPPRVVTGGARRAPDGKAATLEGELKELGGAAEVEVGFQYRPRRGVTDLYEKTEPWKDAKLAKRSAADAFSAVVDGLDPSRPYDYRAVVKHPLIAIYGQERVLETPAK